MSICIACWRFLLSTREGFSVLVLITLQSMYTSLASSIVSRFSLFVSRV